MSVVIPFPAGELVGRAVARPASSSLAGSALAGPTPSGGGVGAAPLVPLHAAVAPARRRHRGLVAAAGSWALARGVPLPADHVGLWAAVVERSVFYGDPAGLSGPWYASELGWFLCVTVGGWCAGAGCPVPGDLPESLWYLYGFLTDTGRLHPAGDPLTDLRAALAVAAGLQWHRPAPFPPPVPGPPAA